MVSSTEWLAKHFVLTQALDRGSPGDANHPPPERHRSSRRDQRLPPKNVVVEWYQDSANSVFQCWGRAGLREPESEQHPANLAPESEPQVLPPPYHSKLDRCTVVMGQRSAGRHSAEWWDSRIERTERAVALPGRRVWDSQVARWDSQVARQFERNRKGRASPQPTPSSAALSTGLASRCPYPGSCRLFHNIVEEHIRGHGT